MQKRIVLSHIKKEGRGLQRVYRGLYSPPYFLKCWLIFRVEWVLYPQVHRCFLRTRRLRVFSGPI